MSNIFESRENLKPYEYPNLLKFADSINKAYWIVSEFNFTQDVQDFKVNLNDYERGVIERAMLAISQIEVSVKTFWADLYKRMPKPEIAMVGYSLAENEVRHVRAYSHLIELLGLNDKFETLMDVPEIQGRVKYLKKYLSGAKSRDDRNYTRSVILFSMFIEHVSLFSQFLIIMSFNKEKNLLPGISNVVEATSIEEECFKPCTEILTPNGWTKVNELEIGDPIYQYDMNSAEIQETKVLGTVEKDFDGELIKFHKQGNSIICTPNHRMVYYNPNGKILEKPAIDFKGCSKKFIPRTGKVNNNNSIAFTMEHRLRIAIQADGSKLFWKNAKGKKIERGLNGGHNYSLGLTKKRKQVRLEWILKGLNISFSKTLTSDNNEFTYKFHYDCKENCKSFNWVNLSEIDADWADEFCRETSEWDGYEVSETSFGYSSTNKECIDVVQSLAILAGYFTNIYVGIDNRKETHKDCYRLSIMEVAPAVRSHSLSKTTEKYKGKVNCVSVPSGVIITRNEFNDTFIAGNCHGLFGAELIRIIRNENPEWFDEELSESIYTAASKALDAEGKLIDWIYGDGDLEFLPKRSVIAFLQNRFNIVLENGGFKKQFNPDQKLLEHSEWFEVQMKSNNESDFFYKTSTAYNKGGKSITEDDLFD